MLNIIFAGTPEFAAVTLQALLHSPYTVKGVYTQPDRPAGRGRHLTPSPVKQLALHHHLPVYQPLTLRDTEEQRRFAELQADLLVVVAYGLLLPQPILDMPRLGCLNVHASLLPRWRGAAPIQRAILAGDTVTGITIMQMDEGLDTGPVLKKTECPITTDDTSATVHDRLAALGAETLLTTLEQLPHVQPQPQDPTLATYAHKILKEEAKIDWSWSAVAIQRLVRAFNPWPIAYTHCGELPIRVWETDVIASSAQAQPGTMVACGSAGIDITTGAGALRILKMQLPGGRVLPVADILNARQTFFSVGKCLR